MSIRPIKRLIKSKPTLEVISGAAQPSPRACHSERWLLTRGICCLRAASDSRFLGSARNDKAAV